MNVIRNYKPDKSVVPPQQLLNFIRTNDKKHAIWQYLKRYQNAEFVKSRLHQEYPSLSKRLINTKSKHISDAMKQGEEYFNSATKTNLAIKPLIIYYGMLNLVKALILFGNNRYTLNTHVLEKSGIEQHGLSIKGKRANRQDNILRNNESNLLEEFCYITKGQSIFKLLHSCWSTKDLQSNMRFDLRNLALSHPNSWKAVCNSSGDIPHYFLSTGGFRTTSKREHVLSLSSITQFSIYKKPEKVDPWDYFEKLLPRLKKLYSRDQNNAFSYISNGMPITIDDMYAVHKSITGETYLMSDFNVGIDSIPLHPIEVEYISMFILGSLTRYLPHKWLKNVRYEGGVEMSVVEGLIDSTILSFPKMILEELEGEEYTLAGDVSYWS